MEVTLFGPTGRTILGPTVLTIGRAPDNQLFINNPQISGHHAEIHAQGQGYYIVDLGSTNHTFINEHQLTPNIPRTLNSGDSIRFGTSVVYMYEVTGVPQVARTVRSNPTQLYNQSALPAGQVQANRPSPYHQQNHQNHQQQPIAKRKKGGLSKMQWVITGVAVPILAALIAGGVFLHNSTTPSIPLLHTSYNGTSIDLTVNRSIPISMFNVSEDTNTGNFTANMIYGSCTGQITNGMVNQNSKITFIFNEQAGPNNCLVAQADFTGQLNSAGAITGYWNEPNGNDNGSFNIS